jgi:Zn2+/Cd2+-exporting ATPase
MSSSSVSPKASNQATSACFTRAVAEVLAEEPTLEAVTIDRTHQKISLATLGRADVEKLSARIATQVQQAQEGAAGPVCSLLSGAGDCSTCETPLTEQERKNITIQHTNCSTTIARVTCPTAPRFWRWRNLPFPKVVQRDVEFLEHTEEHDHADEWRAQLLLAAACGALGLLAAYAVSTSWRIPVFALSYLAGAWFPSEEVWERLRQRAIDVHFLMLAVAAGAASIGAWAEGATLLFLFSLSGALEHYALGRTQMRMERAKSKWNCSSPACACW